MIHGAMVTIDPDNDQWKQYEELVSADRMSLYYSRRDYLEMVREITKGHIILFLAMDKNNKAIAALPAIEKGGVYGRVINSLPFFGSNPGIVSIHHDRHEAERKLLEIYWNITRNHFASVFIEKPFEQVSMQFQNGVNFTDNRIGLVTHLPKKSDHLLQSFHQKTRNMVNKAMKSGITILHSPTWVPSHHLKEIEIIHKANMGEIGAPAKPDYFFHWIREKIKKEDSSVQIYAAEYKGKIVAGLILLVHNSTAEYYMPAIDKEFRPLAPLNFIIYIAMSNLIDQGIKHWNWGGTILPSQQGVYHFKKGFGAEETSYTYHIRVSDKITSSLLTKGELMRSYPYFYIVPFQKRFTEQASFDKMYEEEKEWSS